MVSNWSVLKIPVRELQSPDKTNLEKEKEDMKPDVPQSPQNYLC